MPSMVIKGWKTWFNITGVGYAWVPWYFFSQQSSIIVGFSGGLGFGMALRWVCWSGFG